MLISEEVLKIIITLLSWWGIIFGGSYLTLVILKGIYGDAFKIKMRFLHIIFISSIFVYGLLAMFGQYEVWKGNEFTKILTTLPLSNEVPLPGLLVIFKPLFSFNHGYFLHYSLIHIWLSIFWNLIATGIFASVLYILKKKKQYLLNNMELNLIFAGSLVFGWPYMLMFIVLMFVIFVLHNIYNSLRGQNRTVIFPSATIAIIFVFVISNFIKDLVPFVSNLNFIVK